MKTSKGLGKFRVIHCVRYNCRAERDYETWIVEEWSKNLVFGLGWREHKGNKYGEQVVIKFTDVNLANEYVERLLSGAPRNTVVKTVVSEIE